MQESPPPIQGPTPTPQEYRFSSLFTGATLGTLMGQGGGVGVGGSLLAGADESRKSPRKSP